MSVDLGADLPGDCSRWRSLPIAKGYATPTAQRSRKRKVQALPMLSVTSVLIDLGQA